jgi:hypothetical protein
MQLTPEQEAAFRQYLSDESEYQAKLTVSNTSRQAMEAAKVSRNAQLGILRKHLEIENPGDKAELLLGDLVYVISDSDAYFKEIHIVSCDVKANTP